MTQSTIAPSSAAWRQGSRASPSFAPWSPDHHRADPLPLQPRPRL